MKNASTVFGCTINPAADNRTSKYWYAAPNSFFFRGYLLRLLTNQLFYRSAISISCPAMIGIFAVHIVVFEFPR
ncbi:hypothetical protein [Achromobacter spanius]|uniref:hypothetical protein n=1 Tax=Achromobacter spanius TaxID=217203 RepID=UPI0038095202